MMTCRFHQLLAGSACFLLVVCPGCAAPVSQEPAIHEIVPSWGLDDRPVQIEISGEAFDVRQSWDFESSAATQFDARYQVRLGELLLDDVRWVSSSRLAATVPPGLIPGEYEVRVTDPFGRTISVPGGYRVTAVEDSDLRVSSYRVDPVGPQLVGVPFQVHVTAVDARGDRVESFNDLLTLTDSTGTVAPKQLGAFVRGEWLGSVEVDAPHDANQLVLSDDKGRGGRSDPFTVALPPPSALALLGVPDQLVVGSCSTPFALELRDAHGRATSAATTILASLSSAPSEVRFFTDAACTLPLGSLSFAAGTSRADLYVQSTAFGDIELSASSPGLVSAAARLHVASALSGLRSPPEARLLITPSAVSANTAVSLTAASSTDGQTSSAALEVSFDFTGGASAPPGVAPWTAWSTAKNTTTSYATAGWRTVRVAVRDADGDIAFATAPVNVTTNPICRVTTGAGDDGASNCANNLGPDRLLSLHEAVRIANASPGLQVIELAPGIVATGPALTLTDDVLIYGAPGARLDGVAMTVTGQKFAGLVGLDVRGATTTLKVGTNATFYLLGGTVDGIASIIHEGAWLYLLGTRVRDCVGSPCIDMTGSAERIVLSNVDADGEASKTFLEVKAAAGNNGQKPVEVRGSVFTGYGTVLRLMSGLTYGAEVFNNTFHANGTAVEVQSGERFVFRNNLFTRQTVAAFTGCSSAIFETRDYHQLFQNASDGCIGSDPSVLTSDPLYLVPAARDFRLRFDSPAKNSGVTSNLDIDEPGPAAYRGSAPDRGGEETW